MTISLAKHVALVTGGTKGIGKAIAEKLRKCGAKVVITARSAPEETAEGFHFIAADHTVPESAGDIAREIIDTYGRIDIIINNAGANQGPGGGYNTLSDEHWQRDFDLNFLSAVRMNKALLPVMISQHSGVIIHISTGAADKPLWDMTMTYSAAKAALNTYSKALSNELGGKGIRVNVVSPGVVKTPLMIAFLENIAAASGISLEEAFKMVTQKVDVPLGRMSEPEEVAGLVAFLVSPEANYITGVNYHVDGGAYPII
ncbi:SDR family oxidoreductase [Terrimonas sp. NA20]|uniref:SDR family oxidoreductase n=1 Tax=Terrimonas ginsenosidimutans TaxID=2908004 RepID=A0ABS9KV86_9BACT|nr:SDR family oxidoreductase [Terrimonas ginsenosidimutans]MCG2616195.1 SDR family oxidoreductase [Terrimonas ginsenosidimutans]